MQRILFLSLTTFSQSGGIEKFNKCFLKGLSQIAEGGGVSSTAMSVYDDGSDDKYYNNELYTGFKGKRAAFIQNAILAARKHDVIIIGHINLAVVGILIKRLYPSKKIILIAHGIEVWEPLSRAKKMLLHQADVILAVSNFTRQKMVTVQKLENKNITIFPNTIDPFFAIPTYFYDSTRLNDRYGIGPQDVVLFTLARVSSTEKYKGYDVVLECLPEVLAKYPNVRYVIGGKYDTKEKERIDKLIAELKLEHAVKVIGFIKDDELVAHYQMSDLFIMPSRKEGFGIVFIEAMACGLPVIAGNIDGSTDALRNGELGTLVDPLNKEEICRELCYFFEYKYLVTDEYRHGIQQKALLNFGFQAFRQRIENILNQLN